MNVTRCPVERRDSRSAGCEVLYRLLALNHRRYAEEVASSLHGRKAAGVATCKKKDYGAKPFFLK